MDLSMQLRAYLKNHPDSITSSLTMRGVLKDFQCPERLRENLVHLIDCGMGTVLREAPRELGAGLIRDIVREMDHRFGTAEKYTLEGIRIWAEVYGIQAARTEVQTEDTHAEIKAEEPRRKTVPPLKREAPENQKIRKHTGLLNVKDMRWQAKLMLVLGIFILVYHLFTLRYFLNFELGTLAAAAFVLICLDQLYILKTGLPVYKKDQNGKYKDDWKELLLLLGSLVYLGLTIHKMVQLEENTRIQLDSTQFYIAASMFLVSGYGVAMMLLRLPKAEKKTV